MAAEYEVTIIGAGLVGLASARALLQRRPSTRLLLLEKEKGIARHQSSHNSGVIHSGIYYRPNSAKARNCRAGYMALLAFCEAEDVPYECCGKVIVARSDSELPYLRKLEERGIANGLKGLRYLPDTAALQAYEPHVQGRAGLWVPETGIIDYKVVADRLLTRCQSAGLQLHSGETLQAARIGTCSTLITSAGRSYTTKLTLNCAGLHTDRVMHLLGGRSGLRILPFRGEYHRLSERAAQLVKNLIYPVPDPRLPFLGVHFTRHIQGHVTAGPNALIAFAREGYRRTTFRRQDVWDIVTFPGFYRLIRRYPCATLSELHRALSKKAALRALRCYLPQIEANDLLPAGAGVRAQACDAAGNLLDDFYIVEEQAAIHVCNAPSPAATACLAIGEHIAALACRRL